MVRCSILAVAAAAAGFLGAEASPCRPTTLTSALTEASSTATSDTTGLATTLTSLTETLSTTVSEITVITSAETTDTTLPETTLTTLPASTTTSQAPVCEQTQVVINPGFEDVSRDIEPWSSDEGILTTSDDTPWCLTFVFRNGEGDNYVSQSLRNLNGEYMFSYRWAASARDGLATRPCSITPSIGGDVLEASYPGAESWNTVNLRWDTRGNQISDAELTFKIQCRNEYFTIINLDDITLTRICGAQGE
ncbi:hypothetical protein NW768_009696 [Fusarium equiseti]|uniref:Uncharacterized protein n=1 Tax=Fusarium equiseti TaxID=61235 RepID=A0ABQ8R2A6_FUSEQ|nr:hypothetical protein NW768_009696 [Fusarium equiseti]